MSAIPEIQPSELARAIEGNEPIQVLDVRAPFRVASGKIDLVPSDQFYNIVGSRLVTMQSAADTGLDPSLPVAVVCGHGNSSKQAAQFLNQLGFSAQSLRGGMAGWMRLNVTRDLPPTSSVDVLMQFDRVGKGALSYVLISDGNALVIDAPRNLEDIVGTVEQAGATVVAVADTHCHADFISGSQVLARQFDAPYYLHPADSVYAYDGTPGKLEFTPLDDGTTISIGRATVRAVHTPGHTEGQVTYVVDDEAALTGDFIFISSVGRPDLAGKTDEWTETLWGSLSKAKSWSEDLAVYPGHYSSDAERNDDRSVGKPLGRVRSENKALQLDQADFTAWVKSKAGSFPDVYRTIKSINVGLTQVDPMQADELEVGKNECAVA